MDFTGNISRDRSYRCRCSDFENWRLQIEPSLRTMIAAGTRTQNQLGKACMSWAIWSILLCSHVISPLVLFRMIRLILALQSGSHSTENNRCLGLGAGWIACTYYTSRYSFWRCNALARVSGWWRLVTRRSRVLLSGREPVLGDLRLFNHRAVCACCILNRSSW